MVIKFAYKKIAVLFNCYFSLYCLEFSQVGVIWRQFQNALLEAADVWHCLCSCRKRGTTCWKEDLRKLEEDKKNLEKAESV